MSANAADMDKKWYAGASIGQSKIDIINSGSGDNKDTAYKAFGGYQFNKYIATELFYTDFGSVSFNGSSGSETGKLKSFGAAAVGSLPLHKNFVPFIKLGLHNWDSTGIILDEDGKNSGIDAMYGLGINIPITKSLSIRTEYEKYFTNVSLISAGLIYKF